MSFLPTLLISCLLQGGGEFCERKGENVRFGGGGFYYTHLSPSATSAQNINENAGGFITIHGRIAPVNGQIQLVGDLNLGFGKSNLKNDMKASFLPSDIEANATNFGTQMRVKFGANTYKATSPIYLNVLYTLDSYLSDIGGKRGFSRMLQYIGVEVEGRVPLSRKIRLEYGVGYDVVVNGYYGFSADKDKKDSTISAYSYALGGYVGFSYRILKRFHYYMRTNLRYESLGESSPINAWHYPKSDNFLAGVELGFGF